MDNARQWKMLTTISAGGLVTAFIVAGCGGGSGGSLFSGNNGSPTATPVPTISGTIRATPIGTPSRTPAGTPSRTPAGTPRATPIGTPRATPGRTPGSTPRPTPRPTIRPTTGPTTRPTPGGGPTPLPTPVANSLFTTFGAFGTLDASGNFTESAGFFSQSRLVRSTTPTPTPEPVGTPFPTSAPVTLTIYTGTYSLANGEKGNFFFAVQRDQSASGSGSPAVDTTGYTLQPVRNGDVLVSLKINGSTGSGTVNLSGVTTGTITITSKRTITSADRAILNKIESLKR